MEKLTKTLDLHGMRYADVPRAIDLFIGSHVVIGTPEIEIITGKSEEMKSMVRGISEDYSCSVQEVWGNPGSMVVNLR
jgi:dsDNA-specific endonuclease/ATPase MutS2